MFWMIIASYFWCKSAPGHRCRFMQQHRPSLSQAERGIGPGRNKCKCPSTWKQFPPCAIVAEIHLLLLTYLISVSTFPLSAFHRHWSHDCSTHQTQQIWKVCFLIHRTCDLEFPPQTSAWCPKSPLLQIQSENVLLQKASVLMTLTRVLSKAEFPVYLYILCSTCAQMIVLICCFIFTVLLRYLKNLQCLGCY